MAGRSNDLASVAFTLTRTADVTVSLQGPDGTVYPLRERATRAPDDYEIQFRGVVGVLGTQNRRVLPDGAYGLTVTAQEASGSQATATVRVTIVDGDPMPPEVTNLEASLREISPNGDGDGDDVSISYGLSKPSTATVYVTDSENRRYLIEAPKKQNAVLVAHLWDRHDPAARFSLTASTCSTSTPRTPPATSRPRLSR